jgi:AcrR family transcriptional regulator
MTERVRGGLFFQAPVVLPRGRHTLTREQVLAAQRERLMAAMTELMAERGYRAVKVGEIAAQAGVSREAFYQCFTGKEACAFAAYDRFIDVLLARVIAAVGPADDLDTFMLGLIGGYVETLQQDLVVARAFQIEMDAVGQHARERRRQALVRFAEFIRARREELIADEPLPMSAYLGVVYAARQLVSDTLDTQERPDLVSLAPELASWMTQLLRPGSREVKLGPVGRRRHARA